MHRMQDLIRLLNSDEDEMESLSFNDSCNDEIDTDQDYRQTLAKLMGQIYLKRELQLNNKSPILLLYVT